MYKLGSALLALVRISLPLRWAEVIWCATFFFFLLFNRLRVFGKDKIDIYIRIYSCISDSFFFFLCSVFLQKKKKYRAYSATVGRSWEAREWTHMYSDVPFYLQLVRKCGCASDGLRAATLRCTLLLYPHVRVYQRIFDNYLLLLWLFLFFFPLNVMCLLWLLRS